MQTNVSAHEETHAQEIGGLSHTTMRDKLIAEFCGTAALLAVVVGSGIMGETLSPGNPAVALLANAIATGAGLYVLIAVIGPISGAHFNPLVTAAVWWQRGCTSSEFASYAVAQIAGAIFGVWLSHVMFGLPILEAGTKVRTGVGIWVSEAVATSGLLLTIFLALRAKSTSIPALVGAYITAAYWFTSSTSFANPAVTIARSLTDTFAGIRPVDAPGFIAAQLVGATIALISLYGLRRTRREEFTLPDK